MKTCTRCDEPKSLDLFAKHKGNKDGRQAYCKECALEDARLRRNADPLLSRRQHLKKQYAITLEEYDRMLAAQGGCCAICRTSKPKGNNNRLHVDHCHTSNRVRGLLCTNCNTVLGKMADDPERLESAAAYLRKHHGE